MFNLLKILHWFFIRPIKLNIEPISAGTGMAIMGGATVLGGLFGSSSARRAAREQAAAIREQTEEQRRQYGQTREDLAPWRTRGGEALGEIAEYGGTRVLEGEYIPASEIPEFDAGQFDIYKDPSYEWRRGEQERGINRGAAGMGKVMSGNRLEELMARGGEMASQEYGAARDRMVQDYTLEAGREQAMYGRGVDAYGRAYGREQGDLNRLWGISEAGRGATTSTGLFGAQAAGQIGSSIAAGGAASAAGTLGQGAAWQQALGDITALGTQYYMGQQQPGSGDWTRNTTTGGYGGTGMTSWSR